MGCDMCGADEAPFLCMVEGVEMQLCSNCKVYGEVKRRVTAPVTSRPKRQGLQRQQAPSRPEPEERVLPDFGRRIKQAREAMGLKQEELGKRLAIKGSKLHKYETGSFVPTLDMVHALERALRVTLTEKYVEKQESFGKTTGGPMTIGDMLKK